MIEDIGGGGLRFLSDLKLPVNDQLVLEFETEVFSRQLKMYGHVVRNSNWNETIYEYAVKFTMDEWAHAEINRMVNLLAIRMRQKALCRAACFGRMRSKRILPKPIQAIRRLCNPYI